VAPLFSKLWELPNFLKGQGFQIGTPGKNWLELPQNEDFHQHFKVRFPSYFNIRAIFGKCGKPNSCHHFPENNITTAEQPHNTLPKNL